MSRRSGSRRHKYRVLQNASWDELVRQLPKEMQQKLERTLRRSLKRRLAQIESLDTSIAPEVVRSQAVYAWRKQHMKGAAKSAKKRMNYARLRDEPSYLQIEQEFHRAYWESLPKGTLPQVSDVEALSLAELCEAYHATHPTLGGSPLDFFMRDALAQVYAQSGAAQAARERITSRVSRIVRTKRLDAYARVRDDDRLIARGVGCHRSFDLYEVTSEDEVAQRVQSSHLVEHILYSEFHKEPVYIVARKAIVEVVGQHPSVATVRRLVCELTNTRPEACDPTKAILERLAKKDAKAIETYVLGDEFRRVIVDELLRNPRYETQFQRSVELRLRVRENVPQTPMDAYPLARTMQRHVTLHVGPTNSGKTHDALQVLAAAPSGAYLGPLRLLAYEKFEELNRMGCVCSLRTGEEAVELAGARHVSSTVEMANFSQPIDVAVIDEAQMIADKTRGHNWTNAILGIPAREVHICCAPHAEQVVTDLVALCEDTLTVVRHERLVPLRPSARTFHLPKDVKLGDALVVFSRKSVHAVAAQVAAAGFRPSVIYGALPHDVRHEEARRFDEGETDVVVATDAIGMGMNLPIRRVVFVEQEKYDGYSMRLLRPEEVQQIAGRAGRFGRYEEGYYTSTRLRREMCRRCQRDVDPISSIPVGIPANIALVRDATLTDCIRQWMMLEQPHPFQRIGVARDLALIGEVEGKLPKERCTDGEVKTLVLALATMAFDERDRGLYRTWQRMVDAELAGSELEFDVPSAPEEGTSLIELEAQYRYCDLLYTYARTFKHGRQLEPLMGLRSQISRAIMSILAGASSR